MAIDDPRAKFREQYFADEEKSPLALSLFVGKVAFPKAAIPLEIFGKVVGRFTRPSVGERLKETYNMMVKEIEHVEATKVGVDDMAEAIQSILRRDAEEFNDKKRERYVKLVGNAFRSKEQINDIASFVETVEQLNERDLTVLRVVNRIMNKEGDWKAQHDPVVGTISKLHPTVLISRSQELSVAVALALEQKTERNTFSREEGYGICNRLLGFGLLHELQTTRELPLVNYCFRLSVQGVRLLGLLGEEVPNASLYLCQYF